MSIKILDGIKFNFINVLATILVLTIMGFFFWNIHRGGDGTRIEKTMEDVLILIVGYFFGSSRASAKKDDTIQTLSQNSENDSVNGVDDARS